MNRQETAIGNGSRWLDGLGGPGRAVPRIIARSRDGNFPLPNVRVGSWLRENVWRWRSPARPISITPKHAQFDDLLVASLELILRPAAS
jgi:hypothetical protein